MAGESAGSASKAQRAPRRPSPRQSGAGGMPTDPHLRIFLLGGFRVTVGGVTVPDERWRLRRARSLVKLLALTPGHQMHREQMMDLLWPDREVGAAANSLHQVLHAARRA